MLKVRELVKSTLGILLNGNEEIEVKKFSIDSRECDRDTWFIPIIGDKVDAHKYIVDCAKCGIVGTYINKNVDNKNQIIEEAKKYKEDICIIEVNDTKEALISSAIYNRNKHIDIPIIAVTGSVGKTSTREMIATVLSEKFNVLKTVKNYNSNIGFPLMLLMIEEQDVCVFEMGMDGLGQIEELSKMAKPSYGVITNIGTSHIGLLGSRENIFKAKFEIVKGFKENALLVVNGDDDFLGNLEVKSDFKLEKFSITDVRNIEISNNNTKFIISLEGNNYSIVINEVGKHHIYNALAAIYIARNFDISIEEIILGIGKFKNFGKRIEKIELKNNITIIDDSYNASYDSMKAGLDAFSYMDFDNKYIVLGDMLELGKYSEKMHEEVGNYINTLDFKNIIICGYEAEKIYDRIDKEGKNVIYFRNKDEVSKYLINNVKKNTAIYFKASNGMNFVEIINYMKDNIS